jgi:hypothetical protein
MRTKDTFTVEATVLLNELLNRNQYSNIKPTKKQKIVKKIVQYYIAQQTADTIVEHIIHPIIVPKDKM